MIANNAAAHIGDISNVSPIFFGNDFPDAPPGLTSEMEPTHSPLFQLLQYWEDQPEEEDVQVPDLTRRPTK